MAKWDQFRAAEYDLPTAETIAGQKSDQIRILEAERAKPGLTAEDYAGIDRELARAKGQPVPSKFAQYAEPAGAGGGRGGQGGPTAEQNFMRTPQEPASTGRDYGYRGHNTANIPSLSDVGAFAAGVGKGVSLGATDYLAAVPMKIMNGGSYADALANVRAINKIQEAEHPKATMAGELTGDIITSAATGGTAAAGTKALGVAAKLGGKAAAATNIAGQAATGATTAAVKEALSNPDATPTTIAQAAGVGGLGGGIGAGIAEGISGATSKYVGSRVKDINKATEEKVAGWNAKVADINKEREAATQTAQQQAEDATAKQQKQWVESIPESGPVPPRPAPVAPKQTLSAASKIKPSDVDLTNAAEYRKWMEQLKTEPSSGWSVRPEASMGGTLAAGAKKDVIDYAKGKLPELATAAALGTGAYLVSGEDTSNDILPWSRVLTTGAAALGGLKSKAIGGALLRSNLMYPGIAESGARLAGQTAGSVGSEYATPQSVVAPKSLIGQEIDKLDAEEQAKNTPPTASVVSNVPSATLPSKWSQYAE